MSTTKSNDVDRVLSQIDLVNLVGEYVKLSKAGKSYKGLCPFHQDNKPSLTVSQEKQLWYCFGCHQGGNAFNFLMQIEGLSFGDALRELARRAGVRLGQDFSPALKQRDEVCQLNQKATEFYSKLLKAREGMPSLTYLTERGITISSIERFQLGCTPLSSRGLFDFLSSKGASPEQLVEAGLCLKSEIDGGYYDRFRKRIIFPIHDAMGRIVGFGARAIDDTEPKYLNSPESAAFSKGNLLYGLHLAKAAINKNETAVLVEGYTDVISCFQTGIEYAVATLGTALTQKHADLLKRYTTTAIIAYDSDSSGLQSMLRGGNLFEQAGLLPKVARFPAGMDPDEILRKRGKKEFLTALEEAIPLTEFRLLQALSDYDEQTPEARRQATIQVAQIIAALKSPVERAHYVTYSAEKMSRGNKEQAHRIEDALISEVAESKKGRSNNQFTRQTTLDAAISDLEPKVAEAEKRLLTAMLKDKTLIEGLSLEPDDFNHPDHRTLAQKLFRAFGTGEQLNLAELVADDPNLGSLVAELTLVDDNLHSTTNLDVIHSYAKTVTDVRKRRRYQQLREEIIKSYNQGTSRTRAKIVAEYHQLAKYFSGRAGNPR